MKQKKTNFKNKKKELTNFLPLDEKISASKVLLITGEKENQKKEVFSKPEALAMARDANLSLLCVDPQSEPPVCKLVDYQKYIFKLKKKKFKSVTNNQKEISISFLIGEKDFLTKLSKIGG
jgi:translation initiation factor IF-3